MSSPTNKKITELDHLEARKFLLEQKSYCTFQLPPYFEFEKLLKALNTKIQEKELSSFYINGKQSPPNKYEKVNYTLFDNKDGKYSWRPLSLIHPAIYVSITNKLTKTDNWNLILKRLEKLSKLGNKANIYCYSIPVKSYSENTDTGEQISKWLNGIERKSIELSLDYNYLFSTDITDYYGSIYTHSIEWALHGKKKSKLGLNKNLIGKKLDVSLQSMNYGQTNGIPQGSRLSDFISEILLAYSDALLSLKLRRNTSILKEKYYILRYRDDYRIFCNHQTTGKRIIKLLSEVLISLNLKLSPTKTVSSSEVIKGSIKPDKYYRMSESVKLSPLKIDDTKRREHQILENLIIIHNFTEKFPNQSGATKLLNKFNNKIKPLKELESKLTIPSISIATDIARKNPKHYPICSSILSTLLNFITDDDKKLDILRRIRSRFDDIPNTGFLDVWLQRMSITINKQEEYHENLCKLVKDEDITIWNSEWLNPTIKKIMNDNPIIDKAKRDSIEFVISEKETEVFDRYDEY